MRISTQTSPKPELLSPSQTRFTTCSAISRAFGAVPSAPWYVSYFEGLCESASCQQRQLWRRLQLPSRMG